MIRSRHMAPFVIYSIIFTFFSSCLNEIPYRQNSPKDERKLTFSLCWDSLFHETDPPDSVCFYFYPLSGDPPFNYICNGSQSTQTIPAGEYQVLAFNCDVEQIQFRNMDTYETAEAFLCPRNKSEDMIPETGMLYGASIDRFSVDENSPAHRTVVPEKLVKRLFFSVNLENIENIAECRGHISGISTCVNLSKKVPVGSERGTVPFRTNPTEKGVEANLFVFGACPLIENEPTVQNLLKLDFTFTDGSTSSAQADLTPLLQETHHNDTAITIDSRKDLAGNIILKASVFPWENGGETGSDIQ